MSNGIVIIGSGFAARQLVKNIRKQDATIPLTLIAADSMDEYNKPDLSHVISQGQRADDLTRQTAGEFAEQFNLHLFPQTWVTDIDAEARVVKSQNNVARRFFLHKNAINFALSEGAKKTHSAQCKNERKECLLMLLLSRITFVESRQADSIFESYITM